MTSTLSSCASAYTPDKCIFVGVKIISKGSKRKQQKVVYLSNLSCLSANYPFSLLKFCIFFFFFFFFQFRNFFGLSLIEQALAQFDRSTIELYFIQVLIILSSFVFQQRPHHTLS
jgi:hypothetical protein